MRKVTNITKTSPLETYYNTTGIKYAIFPNPTSDIINLEGDSIKESTFSIVNIAGFVVKKGIITSKQIHIVTLTSGMYILTIGNEKSIKSTKFIKN